jgi:hypothetical protein
VLAERLDPDDWPVFGVMANAGIAPPSPATDYSADLWNSTVDINLNGVFWTCQAFGKRMIQRGSGSIVVTSSIAGFGVVSPEKHPAYGATEAAVVQAASRPPLCMSMEDTLPAKGCRGIQGEKPGSFPGQSQPHTGPLEPLGTADQPAVDGVVEFVFAGLEEASEAFSGPIGQKVLEDAENFISAMVALSVSSVPVITGA